ncbi:sugar phosphate isomerase/epimerase family protein [Paenibacillus ehimensis]|uniref:sugar phosphate isomerase/epimerase family protein n=1 Tax=Paenibacillus ehimensis TaxID=79264 RepID=UPI000FD91F7F|nr:sugar phosphate isomerase/epimerase family protein [Paenibacillus ehimensis]
MKLMEALRQCAVSTYALLEESLEAAVVRLIRDGWKEIEIMGEGPHIELLDWPEEKLDWLWQLGKAHGVRWTVHAPITGLNPAADEEEARRASMELLLTTLRIAERLECAYVVVHPGEADEAEELLAGSARESELAERVAEFVREALRAATGSAVVIGLENVPPYPSLLGADVRFLERIVRSVDSPRVRIVFDAGHAHLTGTGRCLLSLKRVMPYVVGLHLSDNGGVRDDHWAFGAGSVPLEAVTVLARDYGFAGSWVLELRSVPDAAASAEALARMRRSSRAAGLWQAE